MIRRLALLLVSACVIAGTASAAARKPTDPQKRPNAADQAWAAAIRIHRDDLGGGGDWRLEPSQDSVGAPQGCKEPNLSDLVETGEAQNPDFSRNGSFVGSGAAVFLTKKQATAAFQRVASQSFNRCMVSAFKQGLSGSGARLRILSSGPIAMKTSVPHFTSGRIRFAVGTGGEDRRQDQLLLLRSRPGNRDGARPLDWEADAADLGSARKPPGEPGRRSPAPVAPDAIATVGACSTPSARVRRSA